MGGPLPFSKTYSCVSRAVLLLPGSRRDEAATGEPLGAYRARRRATELPASHELCLLELPAIARQYKTAARAKHCHLAPSTMDQRAQSPYAAARRAKPPRAARAPRSRRPRRRGHAVAAVDQPEVQEPRAGPRGRRRSDVRVAFNARHATAQASASYPCVPTPTKAWSALNTADKAEQVVVQDRPEAPAGAPGLWEVELFLPGNVGPRWPQDERGAGCSAR